MSVEDLAVEDLAWGPEGRRFKSSNKNWSQKRKAESTAGFWFSPEGRQRERLWRLQQNLPEYTGTKDGGQVLHCHLIALAVRRHSGQEVDQVRQDGEVVSW